MMRFSLTVRDMLHRPKRLFPNKEICSRTRSGFMRYTYADFHDRVGKLGNVLSSLGVKRGDRVGTIAWNHHRHLELYLAVPCYGAVLNTLNLRLFDEQLAYVIGHADDRIIFVDDDLLPLLERIREKLTGVKHIVVMTDDEKLPKSALPLLSYEELLSQASPDFSFPEDIDEWAPAAMCYTTATTGDPKGVVYTHRSIYLHSLTLGLADVLGLGERDVIMPVVPMFHVNAWGLPFSAAWFGAKQVLPREKLDGHSLCELIERERVTVTGGVPTLLRGIFQHLEGGAKHDLSSLRKVVCGGSALPRALVKGFREKYGITLTHGYGMTETSPVVTLSQLKSHMDAWPGDMIYDVLAKQGTLLPGLEMKIISDEGVEVKPDGKEAGEIVLRGPWIAGEYYREPEKSAQTMRDGWLRTGDIASLDEEGYIQIVDRTKDLIKSGGEWISSVDLENTIMAHPGVLEASVIGVPHEKWDERPLAVVVPKKEAQGTLSEKDILDFLRDKVAKWWLPDQVVFISEIPKTSVGKFDKKELRRRYAK
ncbi:MAG: fatty-acid--CoA ligase [Candidatus Abyssobacteria bacterium SURF_5]|uniref:Fatty-acid--CoA ligase n=1 Tax=Abyssobacteria bacterium (strain SURF_5) TaxID=2093360 RepID=A0A3A4P7Z9_ABYX5|nr:MAG: fatty-acid--CoA ligase [Candidatus Abyssubacteria bacterium SURF_5]